MRCAGPGAEGVNLLLVAPGRILFVGAFFFQMFS